MGASAFYTTFFQRRNLLRDWVLSLFFGFCSWPRLLMEVFLRREMGERYFSPASVLVVGFLLWLIPDVIRRLTSGKSNLWGPFTLWYVFIVAFLSMGFYQKTVLSRQLPNFSFSFERFSMSTGKSWPQLQSIIYQGKTYYTFSRYQVETLVEPAVFFLPGVLLAVMGQHLGYLLMGCAVIYSLSYVAAYQQGRDFLLDRIDQHICAADIGATMNEGLAPDWSRGVNFPGELPTDPEQRRQVAPAFLNAEDIAYPIR